MGGMLLTIGYEAATRPKVIARRQAAGVEVLADVRAVAASRQAGFSKATLRASLEAEGIAYEHLRGLGTPKAGREATRRGRVAEMDAIVAAHGLALVPPRDLTYRARAFMAQAFRRRSSASSSRRRA